jgi:phosphoribosylformimino-5-aminoimidazole carboxamide ribotide isomerase
MDVIPVIDLLRGQAVAAVRGERATYQPVESQLASSAEPLEVARALAGATGCRSMYVADLDALQGGSAHLAVLRQLCAALPVEFLVDAGVSSAGQAADLAALGAGRVILGTETLPGLPMLDEMIAAVGRERILPSLDVRGGNILTSAPELRGLHPLEGLARLAALGLDRFILLTLDVVGTGGGPDWPLLEEAAGRFPGVRFLAGGGVSSVADLHRAAALGLEGVLTATALHRRWITGEDVAALRRGLA